MISTARIARRQCILSLQGRSIFQLQSRCYTYKHILVEEQGNGVTVVTLNRPEVRNALSMAMAEDVKHFAKDAWTKKAKDLRVVVLTGEGTAFSSGRDLKESATHTTPELKQAYLEACLSSVVAVHECPVPVIVAINGAAFGWGMEVALGADMTIVKPDALLCLPETSLGIFPGAGGVHLLCQRVGTHIAKYLVYTAKRFTGTEAKELGVVNEVHEDPLKRALEIACRICCNGPLGVRGAKALFNELEDKHQRPMPGKGAGEGSGSADGPLSQVVMYQQESMRRRLPLSSTKDFAEALRAFKEKEMPVFKGE